MLNYLEIRCNEKQFISLTSLTVSEFDDLLLDFESCYWERLELKTMKDSARQRQYKRPKTSVFHDVGLMLFFILNYLKTNSLQEDQAAKFDMKQPQANKWIHFLLPVLRDALAKHKDVPDRNPLRLEWSLRSERMIFLDGTERNILRSSDSDEQKEFYSGKKNPIP